MDETKSFMDDDTKLILSLLTEYADKLVSLCKQVEKLREQLFTRVLYSYLFFASALVISYFYIQGNGRSLYSSYSFLFIILASLSAAVLIQTL
jgi:hypothetical protein